MSSTMTVFLVMFSLIAVILLAIDHGIVRKRELQIPVKIRKLIAAFITFAAFFYAFCLLEITVCSMV